MPGTTIPLLLKQLYPVIIKIQLSEPIFGTAEFHGPQKTMITDFQQLSEYQPLIQYKKNSQAVLRNIKYDTLSRKQISPLLIVSYSN